MISFFFYTLLQIIYKMKLFICVFKCKIITHLDQLSPSISGIGMILFINQYQTIGDIQHLGLR